MIDKGEKNNFYTDLMDDDTEENYKDFGDDAKEIYKDVAIMINDDEEIDKDVGHHGKWWWRNL